jgi:hypothetical protein
MVLIAARLARYRGLFEDERRRDYCFYRWVCSAAFSRHILMDAVPPTSTIEQRAEALAEGIRKAGGAGKSVNLIG